MRNKWSLGTESRDHFGAQDRQASGCLHTNSFAGRKDKYCIDIYKPEHEKAVVAILITLQYMIKDREATASTSASAGSSN